MKTITIGVLCLFAITSTSYSLSKKDFTKKYYSKYYFTEEKIEILNKIEVSEKELDYIKYFWIVYYDSQNRIVGEEYYKNFRLYYFYLYKYSLNQTEKRGFYWHGITDQAFFRAFKRSIWQGYYFKRDPDIWWIYDLKGKLISKSYHKSNESEKIDYTDQYFYKGDKLIQIKRYRDGRLTKIYNYK